MSKCTGEAARIASRWEPMDQRGSEKTPRYERGSNDMSVFVPVKFRWGVDGIPEWEHEGTSPAWYYAAGELARAGKGIERPDLQQRTWVERLRAILQDTDESFSRVRQGIMYGLESRIESDAEEIMYGEIARREFTRAEEDEPENKNLETAMLAGMIRDERNKGRFTKLNERELFCSLHESK